VYWGVEEESRSAGGRNIPYISSRKFVKKDKNLRILIFLRELNIQLFFAYTAAMNDLGLILTFSLLTLFTFAALILLIFKEKSVVRTIIEDKIKTILRMKRYTSRAIKWKE